MGLNHSVGTLLYQTSLQSYTFPTIRQSHSSFSLASGRLIEKSAENVLEGSIKPENKCQKFGIIKLIVVMMNFYF